MIDIRTNLQGYIVLVKLMLALMLVLITPNYAAAETSHLEKLFIDGNYTEFMPQAELLAKSNDSEALFLLGKAYHLGKGVDKDIVRAKVLYGSAAQLGSARAMHNLGTIAMDEYGGKHLAKAIQYFEKALQMGFENPTKENLALAYRKLAAVCEQIGGCTGAEINELYRKSANMYASLYEAKPSDERLDQVMFAYTQAYVTALNPAIQQELRAAVMKWLNLGIEHNLPNAFHNMGCVYYYADNDVEKGREWFKKGADHGLAISEYAIGTTYEEHEDNPDKAYESYEKAMEMGSEQAAHKVCDQFRMNASAYPGECCNDKRIPLLDKALECYEKVSPEKYEWAVSDAMVVADELSSGVSEIDGLERIVARAKIICNCDYESQYSSNKLMLKLKAIRLYKSNFDGRKNAIPPGEIQIRVPERHAHFFSSCRMSWISADTKGEAYGNVITGRFHCKSDPKGNISFEKDYSGLIREVLAKGDTILLTDSFGVISYLTYKICDAKPCLVSALYQWD